MANFEAREYAALMNLRASLAADPTWRHHQAEEEKARIEEAKARVEPAKARAEEAKARAGLGASASPRSPQHISDFVGSLLCGYIFVLSQC